LKLNPLQIAGYPAPARLAIFVLALLCLWVPFAGPIYAIVSDSNLTSILTMVILYGEFILLVRWWGRHVYQQPHLLRSYGLQLTRQNAREILRGLAIGFFSLLAIFALQGMLGWLVWKTPDISLPKIILEGLIVSLGIGFAEELLFRGWLLDELQRDYTPTASLWADATLFALLHFIKPAAEMLRTLPVFPSLLVLGLALVWAKRSRSGRLGLPAGLHAGLVWGYYIINVGQIARYSGKVPEWLTGIDRNPLAGITGLLFLGTLAFFMWRASSDLKPQM
jgi:membrane protease YdiL (CAAX protease family)